jgi:hypothetical protein
MTMRFAAPGTIGEQKANCQVKYLLQAWLGESRFSREKSGG